MSASFGSEGQQQQEAGGAGQTAGKAIVPASPVKAAAWVPKVKQQQPQSDDRRSSVSSTTAAASSPADTTAAIHDLGSDLIDGSGAESAGAGKGKNRSKNKKMNWKPLPVPIIRRDPHDRDRDIRGSTRKYGFSSGMGGGSAGAKKQTGTPVNGYRNSAPGAVSGISNSGTSTGSSNNNLSHQMNQNSSTNHPTHSHSHPLSPPQNNNNNNHHNSAQSNSSDDSKLYRSSSVSSSSSSRRNHPAAGHQQQPPLPPPHQNQHPQHHHPHQAVQHPDPFATPAPSPSSAIASSSQSAAGEGIKFGNNNNYNQQQQSSSQLQHRMANGSAGGAGGGNRIAGRPPVLRSTGQSPPSSPAVTTQQHHPHRKPQQPADGHQQPYYGRRSGTRVPAGGSSNGGSGRATPNSLKDFSSPEVQYFPMEFATINHDPNSLGNKTSGLMSPVLTLPPGAVVVPAPSFAGGPVAPNSNLAPFYPPTVLPFAAIPVATGPGSQGQPVAVSTPSGLLPVSAFTMPSLPPDPMDLKDKIRAQIEYYFSQENLQRDIFIRKKMDPEGYLPISLIASFHRVQLLTPDVSVIIQSLENSASVELSENHLKARPRDNPLSWPIASETPVLSPTSPPHHNTSPLTNGQPVHAASPVPMSQESSSSDAVKSSNEIPVLADDRIGSGSEADSPEKQMQQLNLSSGGEDHNGRRISSTGGFKHQQASTGEKAAGRGKDQQPQQTPSPSAPAAKVTAAASPSSDATLHPDVPSFVPGQLYAAVVGNSRSSKV